MEWDPRSTCYQRPYPLLTPSSAPLPVATPSFPGWPRAAPLCGLDGVPTPAKGLAGHGGGKGPRGKVGTTSGHFQHRLPHLQASTPSLLHACRPPCSPPQPGACVGISFPQPLTQHFLFQGKPPGCSGCEWVWTPAAGRAPAHRSGSKQPLGDPSRPTSATPSSQFPRVRAWLSFQISPLRKDTGPAGWGPTLMTSSELDQL